MSRPAPPPRLAERLLAATVGDEAWRDSILGDLREEYAVAQQKHGTPLARRWYWADDDPVPCCRARRSRRERAGVPASRVTSGTRGERSHAGPAPASS